MEISRTDVDDNKNILDDALTDTTMQLPIDENKK